MKILCHRGKNFGEEWTACYYFNFCPMQMECWDKTIKFKGQKKFNEDLSNGE
jgi:hypothetical protein